MLTQESATNYSELTCLKRELAVQQAMDITWLCKVMHSMSGIDGNIVLSFTSSCISISVAPPMQYFPQKTIVHILASRYRRRYNCASLEKLLFVRCYARIEIQTL